VEDIRQAIAFHDQGHRRAAKILWLTDDNFFADRDWAVSVLNAIIRSGIRYQFTVQARYEVGFDDEMLLIVNCPGPLLDLFLQAFRRQKLAPVRLKAVLTPTNREWDSVALHAELCRERQAIAEGQAAHRKGPAGE